MKKNAKIVIKIGVQVLVLLALIVSLPYAIKLYDKRSFYDFLVNDAHGKEIKLDTYRGKVLFVVNVATECGLTPQFLQLQKLYNTYKKEGFVVLGFPSNTFNQEPRTASEVITFCSDTYLVDFPIFEKIDIKGEFQTPLYKFLTEKQTNPRFSGPIRWNFDKFLIGRNGKILARFEPRTTPDDTVVIKAVEQALAH